MFLISLLLVAQALTFEVATVKTAQPPNPAAILAGQPPHVGINVQGTRVDIGFLSLAELIPAADDYFSRCDFYTNVEFLN